MSVFAAVKRAINGPLGRLGLVVAQRTSVPSFEPLVALLERHGLTPRTVIDIGVAAGTPWLYSAVPNARYVLIDPTRESLPYMERWAERLNATIHNVALGESDGSAEIDVCKEIAGATLFEEIGPYESLGKYTVPVRRFDGLVDRIERPALCKIDVQGAEVMVLRGMGERLREMDAVVVETSLIATVRNGPEIADVMKVMTDAGLVLYDVVGTARRPLDGALTQIDAVFVPRDSKLRSDRRWAAG